VDFKGDSKKTYQTRTALVMGHKKKQSSIPIANQQRFHALWLLHRSLLASSLQHEVRKRKKKTFGKG
jgi:hypothetical protein